VSDFAKRIAALPPEKRALLEARLRRPGAASGVAVSQDVSFAQERIWTLAHNDLESGHFVLIARFRLPEGVGLATAQEAVSLVIGRHEALRTDVLLQSGKPVQLVRDTPPGPLAAADDAQQAVAAAVLGVRSLTPPLFRALAVIEPESVPDREPDGGLELVLVTHAIVCDGASLAIIRREVLAACNALAQGSPPELPAVRMQPVDYARKQRLRLSGARVDGLVSPWRSLERAPTLLALHTDRPRRPNGLPDVHRYGWEIESERMQRAWAAIHGSGHRAASFWAAALAIVLSRFARQDSIVLGVQARRRSGSDSTGFVGVATNTLPLTVDLGAEPGCRSLAAKADEDLKSILAQEDLAYEKLIAELRIRRSSRHNPLFQAVLAVRSELEPEPACEGHPDGAWFAGGSVLFDIALAVDDTSTPPRLELLFDGHLFDEGTIQALAGAIDTVVKAIGERPEEPVSSLPLAEDSVSFDDPPLPASPAFAATIHGIFERRAALSPERIALRNRRELSYVELNARANQMARALLAHGVQRGQTVGVCMSRSLDLIVSFLAILKAGAAYLPLDPQYPPARLAFMVADSGTRLILARDDALAGVPHESATVLDVTALDCSGYAESNAGLDIGSHEAAYVIYTSGSTGEPKGVVVPHAGVCHAADEQVRHFGLTSDDRILQFSSPNFDASLFEFVMAPRCGGELHLAEVEELIPGPPLLGLLAARGITVLTIPPSTLAVLAPIELQSLRALIVAGEICGAELVSRWGPGRRFFNAYGPTEASIWATVAECVTAERPPAIGKPLAHMWVRVVDQQMRPVPAGAPGELLLGGPGVALGYLNRPELTAERFIYAPGLGPAGVRWYRTGDVVRADCAGRLWYLGRADRQLKVRGFRIEPAEVEDRLLQIPGVSSAAVEVESEALVAYYTAEGKPIDAQELQDVLARQLPQHMVPQRFVPLDVMPVGANGKLDRGALVNLSRQHLAGIRPARNDTERTLVEIWKTVLKLDDVGIEADFFSLGGHSLLAASVMSRAAEALGRELPLRVLFRSRTIASLAEVFDAAGAAAETLSSEAPSP
jgi:amino acid adenylation domain-containing protein